MKIPVILILACAVGLAQQPAKILTLPEAEAIALRNHPRIRAAEYRAKAADATVQQARAAFYPVFTGSITAVYAQELTRVSAGTLQDQGLSSRGAAGVSLTQMVTDFGRTSQLAGSNATIAHSLREETAFHRTRVLLHVRESFFRALQAQSVLQAARKNLETRQLTARQINRLAESNLRSSLDASFADVNVSEAELLVVRTENDLAGAMSQLAAAMGEEQTQNYELRTEETPAAPGMSTEPLIQKARERRPDLAALRLQYQGTVKLADAERRLKYPTVSIIGATGLVPLAERRIPSSYGAFGVNVNVPILNGHLFRARHEEAAMRSQAVSQEVRDMEIRIANTVRLAWLNAQTAWRRLTVTRRLAEQAQRSLRLAQTRYELGLSTIIELSQAQLNETNALISDSAARFDYQLQRSVLDYETGGLR